MREAGGDRANRASSPVSSRLVNSASAEARVFEIRLIALAEQSTVLALLAKQLLGASYGLTTVLKVPPAAAEALHSNPTGGNENRRPNRFLSSDSEF